jgi:hypothetical protein
MKKLLTLLLIGLLYMPVTATAAISYKDGVFVSAPNQDETALYDLLQAAQVDTPQKYSEWINRKIDYSVTNSTKRSCRQILNKGIGDCKDFSMVNREALELLGYKSTTIALFRKNWGHAICYFIKDGFYCYFDNGKLRETKVNTLTAFYQELKETFNYVDIYNLNLDTQVLTKINE